MAIRAPDLPSAVAALVEGRRARHLPVGARDLVPLWASEAVALGVESRGPVDIAEAAAVLGLDPMRPLSRADVAALLADCERAARARTPQWSVSTAPDGAAVLVANLAGRRDNYRAALCAFRVQAARQRRATIAADRGRGLTVEQVAHRWGVSPRSVKAWSRADPCERLPLGPSRTGR